MTERDYVLGTHDDEIDRLGLQHRVWRPRVIDAWRRAGIGVGQTVIDVGAGPGHATADLAELVGSSGRVIALERSRHFLDFLAAEAERRGTANIVVEECDVAECEFGDAIADAAWCRWVLCFLAEPQRAVANIARALKPGGFAVFHEYADYRTWQMMPPNADLDRFRGFVVQSWNDAGGEPDVGLKLPGWASAAGLEIVEMRLLIDVIDKTNAIWQWPASFMATNAERLRALGYIDAADAGRFAATLDRADDDARMITPLVVEIIARRI